MAFGVDRVLAVSVILPDGVGEKLVLGSLRPVFVLLRMKLVSAHHFLQENQVGMDAAQLVAQLVHHHAPVELGKSLVDVVGDDPNRLCHFESVRSRGVRGEE